MEIIITLSINYIIITTQFANNIVMIKNYMSYIIFNYINLIFNAKWEEILMNNYNPNQLTTQASAESVEQKAAQLKQNQQQLAFQNVQQYVKTAQTQSNVNTNSVEQNAKQLEIQNAKNYIQQMNSKMGMQ